VSGPVLDLDPQRYEVHPVHRAERTWSETNCYSDLWTEVIHSLGSEPRALGYMLSGDFDGSQWTMFKPGAGDLWDLYRVDVAELNVWRPLEDHIDEQLAMGRLLTVEVDAYHLPDTAGVSYMTNHVKTTLVPNRLDREGRRLEYFHGAGYFELSGADLDGIWPAGALPPYVELVRLDHLDQAPRGTALLEAARATTRRHLERRPADNPVGRMLDHIQADLPALAEAGPETFHDYAFGTCRQLGAAAEVGADHADWLGSAGLDGAQEAASRLRRVAEGAKELQFVLARSLRRRAPADIASAHAPLAQEWDAALALLEDRLGP
jgi:hypothetical protein